MGTIFCGACIHVMGTLGYSFPSPLFMEEKYSFFGVLFYKICGFMTIFLNCYDHRLFLYMYIMGTLGI